MHRLLVVICGPADAELAADMLWGLGVTAIDERSVGNLTELWTSVGDEVETVLADVEAHGFASRIEEIDTSVVDTWRQHVDRFEVSARLAIRPAWVTASSESRVGQHELVIEPGATFGMGDHPTTRLCLRAVDRLVDRLAGRGAQVLDVGTGSGVLAVAAAVLGAGFVTAIDLGPHSPIITRTNAAANGVGDRIVASDMPLSELDGWFDLILANILAPVLIEMAADLRRVLAPEGRLVISGLLGSRYRHVLDRLAPLRPIRIDGDSGWVAVELMW